MAGSRKGTREDLRGRALWPSAVAAWRASGLTAPEFCRRRGLALSTFRWWRWRLSREVGPRSESATAPSLLPVRVVDTGGEAGGAPPPDGAPSFLEVVLPSGARLRVPAGFDERTVAGVLWALAAVGPC